jgi:cytochrome c-type biogenesis protein CcsB
MWTFLLTLSASTAFASDATDAIRYLPVQDAGRIKPLDTFARETLQLVYGSQYWDAQKIVEINHKGLKDSLKLDDGDVKYYSPNELFANPRLGLVMQELGSFRETKQKLTPYFQAVQRLESQLAIYQGIKQGTVIRVAPPKTDSTQAQNGESERWTAVNELQGDLQGKFSVMMRAFIQALPSDQGEAAPKVDASVPTLAQAVDDFKSAARMQNPSLYPTDQIIAIEVHYKSFRPFLWAWIFYLTAAVIMAFAWQSNRKIFYQLGWLAAGIGFLLHSYGFVLRCYLTGRPPVSNMYETVIWVSWGAMAFSLIFEAIHRRKFTLIAGTVVGVLCLVVADLAPLILDTSIQPLEPVLRSNMWLTIHVLTITLSYSAFFLAWGLGNIGLAFILRGEKPTDDRPRTFAFSIYRALQVGVVLLASGTILGGIWADYSWGRFWGWDPKETWAFIALLGYLALLHARLVGLVQNFGTMVGAVIAFNLIIMSWYGVNFVLGAGLHSYGFGAGGVQYVGGFVVANLIYVGYVAYIRFNINRPATPSVKTS